MGLSCTELIFLIYGGFHPWGKGNGNPLQYSCLENPKDGGTWWAAIYGVTQSQTRLMQLSSSSNNKKWERKIKETTLLTTTKKRIKYIGINNLPKEKKTCMQKTIRYWWKRTQTDGEIYHVPRLGESIMWKWLYCRKQSTDSMQCLSNYQGHFSHN